MWVISFSSLYSQEAEWKEEGYIPGIHEYIHITKKPLPLNLDKVKKEIGYPILALKKRLEGLIYVRVLVDEQGRYITHKITRKSHPILVDAVEKKVYQLKFLPAEENGIPLKYWINISFYFKLSELKEFGVYQRGLDLFFAKKQRNVKKAKGYLDKGFQYLDLMDFESAQKEFTRGISVNSISKKPDKLSNTLLFHSYYGRAEALSGSKKWANAIQDYTEAIGIARLIRDHQKELATFIPQLYLARGKAFLRMLKPQRALSDFQWIRLTYPNHEIMVDAQVQSYFAFMSLKQYDAARGTLDEIKEVKAEKIDILLIDYYKAQSYIREKQYPMALEILEAIPQTTSSTELQIRAWNDLSEVYLKLGNYQKALTTAQFALDLDISNPRAYYNKGNVILALEGLEAACENFQIALKNDLSNPYRHLAKKFIHQICIPEFASGDK